MDIKDVERGWCDRSRGKEEEYHFEKRLFDDKTVLYFLIFFYLIIEFSFLSSSCNCLFVQPNIMKITKFKLFKINSYTKQYKVVQFLSEFFIRFLSHFDLTLPTGRPITPSNLFLWHQSFFFTVRSE